MADILYRQVDLRDDERVGLGWPGYSVVVEGYPDYQRIPGYRRIGMSWFGWNLVVRSRWHNHDHPCLIVQSGCLKNFDLMGHYSHWWMAYVARLVTNADVHVRLAALRQSDLNRY